ncbi:hypothetical protein KI387_000351, partial [Taxus chinensis]
MEKKSKALDNGKGVKGEGLHRHPHHGHGSFSKPCSFNSAPLHGDPIEKVPDPKPKKAILMRRPNTHPELLNREKPAFERTPWLNLEAPPHLSKIAPPVESAKGKSSAKLLVNVTVAQSIGPLRVLLSNDATLVDAIKAALAVYAKEGRRPTLSSDPLSFGMHYSQFSIECVDVVILEDVMGMGFDLVLSCNKDEEVASTLSLTNEDLDGYVPLWIVCRCRVYVMEDGSFHSKLSLKSNMVEKIFLVTIDDSTFGC